MKLHSIFSFQYQFFKELNPNKPLKIFHILSPTNTRYSLNQSTLYYFLLFIYFLNLNFNNCKILSKNNYSRGGIRR